MGTKTIRVMAALLLCAGASAGRADAQAASPPLTFRAALDLAASRNLGLAAARRQRAIREAQVRIAGQRANPEFGFEVTQDSPHENLTFGYPIELGGQRSRRIALAREELTLADLDERTEMRTLRRNLRLAFYGLLAADQRVRLAGEVLDLSERTRQVAQARFEAGATPKLDVLQADLGLARAQTELDLARSTRASAQADLNAVLNQPAGQAVALTGDLAEGPATTDLAGAMRIASASNIDLLSAEREAAVEERRLGVLKAERVPTPTVTFGLPIDAPDEFTVGKSLGIAMAIPLFSRNKGEIAQSMATIDWIHAKRDAARRVAESAVFGALARMEAERRQVDAYRGRVIPAATELATLAEESYKAGRNSVLGLIDAQRSLRDVSREYLQALLDFQTAIADLEEVVGAPLTEGRSEK
ncbi:MAG TPA: TolC family protein [Vicinamibacterales bacterium]|jgi:cobalt-zinc-cadmium efflux system outer membrane protein